MDITVKVAPSTHAFGTALAAFVVEIQKALADGWQPASDIPEIVLDGVKTLAPAIGKLQDVLGEAAGDKQAFANAVALTIIQVVAGGCKK